MTIKRVTPLDVLKESDGSAMQDEDERFDTDFALMAGELSKLISDLVAALGGEENQQTDLVQKLAQEKQAA